MTEEEAAKMLGKTTRTLGNWRSQGLGPRYLKIGKNVEYDPADIEEWRQSQRREPISAAERRAAKDKAVTSNGNGHRAGARGAGGSPAGRQAASRRRQAE